ncbi:hypothetical protein TRFO_28461 [Tritrichomonas foetus]|uniref:Right handed beta helix domain-containing protein n=1 Tax=Tritrichomonas foetus TaxID=1144522 RepID=A0A1J4K3N6_9EUKA|nr:hypothetical protein TRFO_28461 [Tritrichomonas foetus]|eukprot:OHT04093.1 hypothetical protein TRFO_28461 [Tritrichomonas foetus]
MFFVFLLASAFSGIEELNVIDADLVFPYINSFDCDEINGQVIHGHQSFIDPQSNCAIITNSIFESILVYNGQGGAILFKNNAFNSSLFINSCTFTDCHNKGGSGGAIESESHEVSILYTCSFNCSAFVEGQFAYLQKLYDSKSEINVTTVYDSIPSGDGQSPIFNLMSDSRMFQLNMTGNLINAGSGSLKINNKNLILHECDIVGSKGDSILTLNSYDCTHDIQRLNIINNSANNGIVFFNGNWAIKDTIFQGNSGDHFYNVGKATLTFTKCVFDVNPEIPSNVKCNDCDFDKLTETFAIGLLNTHLCAAEISATPYLPDDDSKNKAKLIGAIVGGSVGLVVVIVAIVVGIILYRKKQAKDRTTLDLSNNPLLAGNERE